VTLRIVHIITGLGTGGAEHSLLKLVQGLAATRFRSCVISLTTAGDLAPAMEAAGAPVRALGMRPSLPDPLSVFRLAHLLRAERPHVVQTWLPHADLLGGIAARMAGGPPVVWNIRYTDLSIPGANRGTQVVVRACAALSRWLPARIVSCTQRGAEFYARLGYDASRLRTIPNGYDTERYRPDADARSELRAELGAPAEAMLIGLVARFDPLKDHANFIAAALEVAEREPTARFLLAGTRVTWDNAALNRAIVRHRERFHLLGPREDIPRILAALDVNVLSSVSEGFPNVVAEAMACGVPCAVTDVGDVAHMVADTGRVVPPRDPRALAAAIVALVEQGGAARRALGRSARSRIETEYGLETMVKRYEDLYEELAGHVRN
jgi:glycosyltransferase involved in cell wall biosynthesis